MSETQNKINESTTTGPKKSNQRPKQYKNVASTTTKEKLPTPPPDPRTGTTTPRDKKPPTISEASSETPKCTPKVAQSMQEADKEMFEYIESLHRSVQGQFSRSTSTFSPAIVTEEAFDHLEKLYKLMEQMLELREQNVKLHRRVRDLEHLNNLEKLQKQLESPTILMDDPDCSELDKDTAFAETILESILQDSTSNNSKNKEMQLQYQKQKSVTGAMLKPSILRRHRSGSATEKQVTLDAGDVTSENIVQGARVRKKSCDIKTAKISKWTKVKAAFRWEKASNTVSDIQPNTSYTKSQDSGIHVPVNLEIARYLRVPSTSDDTGLSPGDSGAGISTPGSLSTASSNEDFRNTGELRTPMDDFKSSDDENHSHHGYIPSSKEKQHKGLRLPWAKMKDIIHTRNSFKKKHRLSGASDDIQIDVEFCSDNEDNVFEDDVKSRATQISSSPSPNPSSLTFNPKLSPDIRPEVIERYQKALAEDHSLENDKVSRWSRVRKAFLSNENEDDITEKQSSSAEEEIQRSYRKLQKKLSLEFQEKLHEWERLKQNSPSTSTTPATCSILEDTKDPFFMKKIDEWQKIKSGHSPTMSNRENRGIQLAREYELPPEFKKKLQEWEKIKKSAHSNASKKKLSEVPRWKSLSGHRSEAASAAAQQTFEYPVISEDFRKKLEEWKQIKASGGCTGTNLEVDNKKLKDKTPSPKLSRKNSSPKQVKKHKDKEHWFEKELCKIEKEKHRLERDRNKFLEREERMSKLRRSMMGGAKKEILIHTPSGFRRFEGISRKFTQKLYEWEKAQGIGPEESTFALLSSSSFTPEKRNVPKRHSTSYTPPLHRSKSADSIAKSALNLTCPIMSHQPSSLSLNDVDELEKTCLADSSKGSSIQFLEAESQNDLNLDEPEAVLVEVEDYEEETAEPLFQMHVVKQQRPIYQRQEVKTLCAGETVAAPKIQRSESTRAQNNYNLIEHIVTLLSNVAENECQIKKLMEFSTVREQLQAMNDSQKDTVTKIIENLLKLQEANNAVTTNIAREEANNLPTNSHLNDMLDSVQDISSELLQLAEELEKNVKERNIAKIEIEKNFSSSVIIEIINELRSRMSDLRRHLSYLCAASDLTAPIRRKSNKAKLPVYKTLSSESKESRCDTSDNSRTNSQKEKRYIKSESTVTPSTSSQGAVKKRIRYRQKSTQQKSICVPDSDEEDVSETYSNSNKRQHKKVTRQRSISENSGLKKPSMTNEKPEKLIAEPTDSCSTQQQMKISNFPTESPVTVFVKTTRKLFTPIAESGLARPAVEKENLNEKKLPGDQTPTRKCSTTHPPHSKPEDITNCPPTNTQDPQSTTSSLPPLPSSPVPQRKVYKDVSPSIRLMMAKYNQKLSEQDTVVPKSGGSSGSSSPIWRSPISERRVKAQTERYQEELQKLSPLLGQHRKEVQKSASASYLNFGSKQVTIPIRKTSLSVQKTTENPCELNKKNLTLDISLAQKNNQTDITTATTSVTTPNTDNSEMVNLRKHSPEVRLQKLQKAKEDFLKAGPHSAPVAQQNATCEEALSYPTRNRLSQISVGSETSFESGSTFCGHLVKSVSAGMINIDAESYKQIDPELHGGGYVSLPRSQKKPKNFLSNSKFGFSSIAAKFRKVKMRKGKNSKMDTVATLCRQSLVVDINNPENEQNAQQNNVPNNNNNNNNNSIGDVNRTARDSSPTTTGSPITKSQSWIKRSLFKK